MKICFVGLDNLPLLDARYEAQGVGGEQVQQTLLARALARRGHDVHMIVGDWGQAPTFRSDGLTVHRAFSPSGGLPVLRAIHPRITHLWSALDRADAEVLYLSCASPQLGVAAAWARLRGRRLVFRLAHDWDCDPARALVRYPHNRAMYAWGLRRADVVLAQSQGQVAALAQHTGLSSEVAAMLVPPAVSQVGFQHRPVDVLWVNNIRPFKRPQGVLDLARRLPHLSFLMVGGTQPGYEDLYQRIHKDAAALPNLRFVGPKPFAATHALFGQARVLLNTSESEGFPNAFLQAWRHSTPVVSHFDPDQIIERQSLGGTGADEAALADHLHRLCRSEWLWRQTGERCQTHMRQHHDEAQVLQPYLQALGGAGPSTPTGHAPMATPVPTPLSTPLSAP
jgi:glycosyltransferase involved in cell wall biosynthesis